MNNTIHLRDMLRDEFPPFYELSISDYSKDLVQAGSSDSEEAALEDAKKQINELLPNGMDTPNHYFYVAENEAGDYVGHIWYMLHQEGVGFICEILIHEAFRKRGYGRQTLALTEADAHSRDMSTMILSVFRFNDPAIALYRSMGYTVNIEQKDCYIMLKDISQNPSK